MTVCRLKAASLQSFIMATPGHSHSTPLLSHHNPSPEPPTCVPACLPDMPFLRDLFPVRAPRLGDWTAGRPSQSPATTRLLPALTLHPETHQPGTVLGDQTDVAKCDSANLVGLSKQTEPDDNRHPWKNGGLARRLRSCGVMLSCGDGGNRPYSRRSS